MKKIGRNDPCPCGSGKKFKKCHMGREDELVFANIEDFSSEMSGRITGLPEVSYGRSQEMINALDIRRLTGNAVGIRCVDLKGYADLNIFGSTHFKASKGKSGGVFINLYKTIQTDPDNLYLAIAPDIDDSTLIHELAHILDYLGGSKLMPGTLDALSLELGIPVDHLEHPMEFGYWLEYLKDRFGVQLDADDTIIWYLYQKVILLPGKEIEEKNRFLLKSKSDQIFRFLSEHNQEIDELIRDLPGYMGVRKAEDNSI